MNCVLCLLQVFNKLIRRYKYLEKGFQEEIKKVCLYMNTQYLSRSSFRIHDHVIPTQCKTKNKN